ncbi:MAG: hypothetical protein RJA55_1798 [Acidobacteriota bacterium]|jgi:hypothetical protein
MMMSPVAMPKAFTLSVKQGGSADGRHERDIGNERLDRPGGQVARQHVSQLRGPLVARSSPKRQRPTILVKPGLKSRPSGTTY